MTLPLADPQFWIVTGAAAVALGLMLRPLLRRSKPNALPCAKCSQAGPKERPGRPR